MDFNELTLIKIEKMRIVIYCSHLIALQILSLSPSTQLNDDNLFIAPFEMHFCRQQRQPRLFLDWQRHKVIKTCHFIEMHAEIVMWNHYDDDEYNDDERMRCRLTIIQLIWFGH